MTATPEPAPEFSRPVAVEALVAGAPLKGEAGPAERAALARRFGVPEVRALSFRAAAEPWGPGGWKVAGEVEAALVQNCVVTLEPVDTRLSDRFARYFAPAARLAQAEGLLDPDADESPEPLGAAIDVGEIAAEAAALAIDPYPRKPGAVFEGAAVAPPGAAPLTDEAVRPFAALAALKARGEGG